MANSDRLIPFIRKWEGGFANHSLDPGGATMWGITLNTFRVYFGYDKNVEDLKAMTEDQWRHIFINGFWDKALATQIVSQRVANMVVDWGWHSGMKVAIKALQKVLGVQQDGTMGPVTMSAINRQDGNALFDKLWEARKKFFEDLVARRPSSRIFLRGWMNRINDLKNLY